jgi:hypothetical protein
MLKFQSRLHVISFFSYTANFFVRPLALPQQTRRTSDSSIASMKRQVSFYDKSLAVFRWEDKLLDLASCRLYSTPVARSGGP